MLALIAFALFVIGFIFRAVNGGGLKADDYVLWMLAGLACLALSVGWPWVESRRRSA